MKRSTQSVLFAAAFAAAILVPSLRAQDQHEPKGPRGDHPRREMMGEHMAKELGLSEDQQKQVKAINESYKPQMEAIRKDASLSRDQKREKAQALNKEREGKVDAVLTPEQRTKAQAMREKMKERMKDRREGKGPHGHGGPDDDHDGPPPPPEGK
jgi:Spy/CpxP family protein refolding chaperone